MFERDCGASKLLRPSTVSKLVISSATVHNFYFIFNLYRFYLRNLIALPKVTCIVPNPSYLFTRGEVIVFLAFYFSLLVSQTSPSIESRLCLQY